MIEQRRNMEKEIDCVICERPDGSYIKTNNGELKIITKNRCDTLNIKRYRIKKDGVEYLYFVDQNRDGSIHTELFSMDGNSIEDDELIKYASDLINVK